MCFVGHRNVPIVALVNTVNSTEREHLVDEVTEAVCGQVSVHTTVPTRHK